jgi:flagellar biogenesis protein FliO
MCCGILKVFGGLGAIVALILVIIALLKQLILLVGFLLTA